MPGDVVIHGVDDEMRKTVRSFLSLSDDCSLARWTVRYRFNNAEKETRQALQTYGYYEPRIEKSLTFNEDCWHAEFDIELGQPLLVQLIDIQLTGEGRVDPEFQELASGFPFEKGARFDHEQYESFKDKLEQTAAQRGYFEAGFTKRQVVVEPAKQRADVELIFDTGPRYSFGPIAFDDSSLTEELMLRYVPFETGDAYDADKIGDLYQALLNSGYFADVAVRTTVQETDRTVPVDVELPPIDADKTRIGIGFSTDIGPRASMTYSNLRLNRMGHRFEGDISVSPIRKEAGAQYRLPANEHRDGWTSFYSGFLSEDNNTSQSRKATVGVRQLAPLSGHWFQTRFLEVVDDRFEVADEEGTNFSVVPGISWNHSVTSTARRPLRGHHFDVELSGTSDAIGSTITYSRVVVHAKVVLPLWFGMRLISRGRVGATFTDSFDQLPPSVRFFSGGDDRIRGFEFKSVGPRDDEGNVIGGDRLAEASLELDRLIAENWAIAVFIDAGNATRDDFPRELEKGAGIGVRWYSPLGPLRIDIAAPIQSEESGVRLHLSFGPDI